MCFTSLQYSLCNEPLIELSNPGASGSVFYLTKDDEFIIKTVMHKEAEFLQKLLPGYYMVSVCRRTSAVLTDGASLSGSAASPLFTHMQGNKYTRSNKAISLMNKSFPSSQAHRHHLLIYLNVDLANVHILSRIFRSRVYVRPWKSLLRA